MDSQQARSLQNCSISTMERYFLTAPLLHFFCVLIFSSCVFHFRRWLLCCCSAYLSKNVILNSRPPFRRQSETCIVGMCQGDISVERRKRLTLRIILPWSIFNVRVLLPVFCFDRSITRRTAGTQTTLFSFIMRNVILCSARRAGNTGVASVVLVVMSMHAYIQHEKAIPPTQRTAEESYCRDQPCLLNVLLLLL